MKMRQDFNWMNGFVNLLNFFLFFLLFYFSFFFFLFSFDFHGCMSKGGPFEWKPIGSWCWKKKKDCKRIFLLGLLDFYSSFLNFVFCHCSTNSDFHHSMMKISWIFFPFLVFLFYFFYFNNFDLIFIHFFSSFHLAQAMVSTKKVMFTSPSLGWASCPLQLP